MQKGWRALVVGVSLGTAVTPACSTHEPASEFTAPPSGARDSGFEAGPIVIEDAGAPPDGDVAADAASCVPTYVDADGKKLDLLLLVDKSSSTVGSKWSAAVAALSAFVSDARSAGLRVGLQFFPRPPDATPACSFGPYAQLRVPFTLLPAGEVALRAALQGTAPDGTTTPTYPALGGAALAVANEVLLRPQTDVGAVLLVTDGEPLGPAPLCGGVDPTSLSSIADLARGAFAATPSVRTFVIGLPGVAQSSIDVIAAAGGTTTGFLIDGTSLESALTQALASVRRAAIPCEYGLPADVAAGRVSLAFVNVTYESAPGSARETIPQATDCTGDGWAYRTVGNTTTIVVCPSTCARVRSGEAGRIDVALGCATHIR